MPSSLVIVALVVAWLVVLVPMIVRKRQEVAKTADSELAARVVRSGSGEAETGAQQEAELDDEEEAAMSDADQIDEDMAPAVPDPATDHAAEVADDAPQPEMSPAYYAEDPHYARRYRPGRGGFDPEAAAIIARAKYAFRQRVVLAMLIGAVVTAVLAAVVLPVLWWAHGAIDFVLISYLGYLRRQVRIETEIRERRQARMNRVRRARQRPAPVEYHADADADAHLDFAEPTYAEEYADEDPQEPQRRERVQDGPDTPAPPMHRAGTVVVDVDDEDPMFDELDEPGNLPYRRAAGE
jgi:hypothetical protein